MTDYNTIVNVLDRALYPDRKKHRHTGARRIDEVTIEIDCIDCGKTLRSYFVEGDEDRPDRWVRWEKWCDGVGEQK